MTVGARERGQRRWVAGGTTASGAPVVHREGVRPVVACRQPSGRRMAVRTAGAKAAGVHPRLSMAVDTGARRPLERSAPMALRARRAAVGAGEREARSIVIEGCVAPLRHTVTGSAIGSVLAAVLVILPVAADAARRRSSIVTAGMAGGAGDLLVRSHQGECRLVVVEGHVVPARRPVAGSAVAAQLACMFVIVPVAAHAIARRADILTARVTRRTCSRTVRPGQGEAGLRVVEGQVAPTGGPVTFTAANLKLAPVWVVRGMTVGALGGDAVPLAVDMTALTIGQQVTAGQHETRELMLEGRLLPRAWVMALATRQPKATLVDIILRVAVNAVSRGLLQGHHGRRTGVAAPAIQSRVFPHQGKGRRLMVEVSAVAVDAVMTRHAPVAEDRFVVRQVGGVQEQMAFAAAGGIEGPQT